MRILLATYGSRGDVEPIVALAAKLKASGADVRLCAPPDEEFVGLAGRAGVPLTSFPRSWRSWATRPSTAEERVPSVADFVQEHIAATYDTLATAAAGCDAMLATGMLHFVARSVAEKEGIPHRFVLFCPTLVGAQPWHAAVAAPLNAHRATLGLAPVDGVQAFLFTGRPWLAADPLLGGKPAGAVVATGAWLLPDDRPLPAGLAAFLEAGPPPVYVGFGSMRMPADSGRIAIETIRALGRRALVGKGWADLAPIDGRDDCFVVGEINQQALFPRVATVIHHGGAGTTTAAARAGAPQVVVPQAADQMHWDGRVTGLGIGIAHDGPIPTTASLSAALAKTLAPATTERASVLADRIRTDGAADAAAMLLELAKRGRREPRSA